MRKLGQITLLAVVAVRIGVPTLAPQDPAVTLQRAIQLETVDGDLNAAIEHYRQAIKSSAGNRSVAARALLRLGGCYEKLGQEEAHKIYQQLVNTYPEQRQEVAAARQRLSALRQQAADERKPRFQKVQVATGLSMSGSGKLSPDGENLAFISGGSLWVLPAHGKSDPNIAGEPVRLTEPMHAWDAANVGVEWSGNGKWIAFRVAVPQAEKEAEEQLFVVSSTGGTPKRVPVTWNRWADDVYTLRYALSEDADTVYYAAGATHENLRVYRMPVAGGERVPLTEPTTRQPALSPDGSKIAYVRMETEGDRNALGTKEIWAAPAGGGKGVRVFRLTSGGWVQSPIWSSDGRYLAFLISESGNRHRQIGVLSVGPDGGSDGEAVRFNLPQGTPETTNVLAGWTKNNEIGILIPKERHSAIYTVPAAGGKATQLTPKTAWMPSWTPDGKRIYFDGIHGGEYAAIEFVPAAGGKVTRLPIDKDFEFLQPSYPLGRIALSPDGRTICYAGFLRRGSKPGSALYLLPVEGGRPKPLTTNTGTSRDLEPAWSPDGRLIAFVRAEPGSGGQMVAKIFVISREGGQPRAVTTLEEKVELASLDWSPDGELIAFYARDRRLAEPSLRLISPDGGPSRTLVARISSAGLRWAGVSWSPDGRTLAYVSEGTLWRVPREGGAPTKIETGLDARICKVDWSPDGRSIAFEANRGGEHELWLMSDFLPPQRPEDGRTVTRLLWSAPDADTSGEVSPDGRYLSYVDWVQGGDLAVRDLKTGQVRMLTNKGGWEKSGDFALNPRWSRDGKRLAYAWSVGKYDMQLDDQAELRIADAAGGGARVLRRSTTYLLPAGWFPDGKSILAVASTKDDPGSIVRVSVDDSKIEMLRKFQWRSHGRVCLSPDGKYIAFDLEAAPDSLNKNVFLMQAAGGAETPLASGPYDERLLAWTPDGRHILFASNRSGTYDVWLLRVEKGKAVGDPELLKQEFGMVAPVGFSPDGKFYFGREVILHDVFLAGWDPENGKATSAPQKATEHFAGSTCRPAWSPDGKKLAYVVQRGNLTSWIDNQVRIRDLATGQERALPKASGAVRSIAWSPDGASLVMCGGSRPGKNVCRIVDATSGKFGREVAGTQGSEIPGRAIWAPDGSAVYYATWKINEGQGRIVKRDLRSNRETVLYSLNRFHNPIYLDVSPDGRYLAFSLTALMEASKVLDPRIMLIPASGGEARELVARRDLTPDSISWSHDSRHVYFSLGVPDRKAHQLCRVPVSGGKIEELDFEIKGPNLVLTNLHLRPDGRQIAFTEMSRRDGEIWVMENFLPRTGTGR